MDLRANMSSSFDDNSISYDNFAQWIDSHTPAHARTIGTTHIQSLVDLKPNKNHLVVHSLLLTVHMPVWLFQCICNRYSARLHKVDAIPVNSKHDVFFPNIHAIFDANREIFHEFSGFFTIEYKIEKNHIEKNNQQRTNFARGWMMRDDGIFHGSLPDYSNQKYQFN